MDIDDVIITIFYLLYLSIFLYNNFMITDICIYCMVIFVIEINLTIIMVYYIYD